MNDTVFVQCCICHYPSRTPEQLKTTSHTYCTGCMKVAYTETYNKMVEEKENRDE